MSNIKIKSIDILDMEHTLDDITSIIKEDINNDIKDDIQLEINKILAKHKIKLAKLVGECQEQLKKLNDNDSE